MEGQGIADQRGRIAHQLDLWVTLSPSARTRTMTFDGSPVPSSGTAMTARPFDGSRPRPIPTVVPSAVSAIRSSAAPSDHRPAATAAAGTSMVTVTAFGDTAP